MTRDQAIMEEIQRNAEFEAHKMLLIRDEGHTAKTARTAAWMEGPIKGQERIGNFLEETELELKP